MTATLQDYKDALCAFISQSLNESVEHVRNMMKCARLEDYERMYDTADELYYQSNNVETAMMFMQVLEMVESTEGTVEDFFEGVDMLIKDEEFDPEVDMYDENGELLSPTFLKCFKAYCELHVAEMEMFKENIISVANEVFHNSTTEK